MDIKRFKWLAALNLIFMLGIFCLQYFGMIAFFSPWMFLSMLLLLILSISGISFGIRGLVGNKGWKMKLMQVGAGAVFVVLPVFMLRISAPINDNSIDRKLKAHKDEFNEICEQVLTQKYGESQERVSSDWDFETPGLDRIKNIVRSLWSHSAGPTRLAVFESDGLIFIEYIGSPDDGQGIVYNPGHKPSGGVCRAIAKRPKLAGCSVHHKWDEWDDFSYVTQ